MTAKECLTDIPGFRFIFDRLELLSSPGRRAARELPFMTDGPAITARLAKVTRTIGLLSSHKSTADHICLKLMQLKDISGTARHIVYGNPGEQPLDDVELFETKTFALLEEDLRQLLAEACADDLVRLPDLGDVISLLDPEGYRAPSFHVYEAYDERLAPLRRQLQGLAARGDDTGTDTLLAECEKIEAEVRRRLSARLHEDCGRRITEAIAAAADLDVLIASARLACSLSLSAPVITDTVTRYEGLVNPAVAEALQAENKQFQPIDITLPPVTTLITGSNMGGKSVTLKTVALAQTMAQLGLYVPAASAQIAPVDTIMLCMGDGQSEFNGLSSYAAEMLRIDSILSTLATGRKGLVLIDEPARTTNPDEGRAIVSALIDLMGQYAVPALITTHYSGITGAARHLRVRGFTSEATAGKLTLANLNDHMDYRLYATDGIDAPREAVRIARILGVNETLLQKAQQYISNTQRS